MPVTLNNTQIVFNNGTIQDTAAFSAPSTLGAIGTVVTAAQTTTSNIQIGATIAGSSLYHQSNTPNFTIPFRSEGTGGLPQTIFIYSGFYVERQTSGNTGYTVPGGATALTGTWRNIGYPARARVSAFDGVYGITNSQSFLSIWVRIS